MQLFEIAKTTDIPMGRAKPFQLEGRTIAVYHTQRGFFATDNTCPHRGGPLAEGDLIGDEITCPWHLWSFDVATGVCGGNPEVRVNAYEVRVIEDRVMVVMP